MRDARTDYYFRKVKHAMDTQDKEDKPKPEVPTEPPKGPPVQPRGDIDNPGKGDPPLPPTNPPPGG